MKTNNNDILYWLFFIVLIFIIVYVYILYSSNGNNLDVIKDINFQVSNIMDSYSNNI